MRPTDALNLLGKVTPLADPKRLRKNGVGSVWSYCTLTDPEEISENLSDLNAKNGGTGHE
jgi:hypothetical protein